MKQDVKKFEEDLCRIFGAKMKESDDFCREIWSAMANIIWRNESEGLEYSATFRAAGGVIADILGKGNYMDWYCSGPYETVSDEIQKGLDAAGWKHRKYDEL